MADIKFIGKVTERVFDNGGVIIRLSLSEKDKELLKTPGYSNLAIQKSQKGVWYAKLDEWTPEASKAKPIPADKFPGADSGENLPF